MIFPIPKHSGPHIEHVAGSWQGAKLGYQLDPYISPRKYSGQNIENMTGSWDRTTVENLDTSIHM